jgi:hypothetical protein
MSRMGPPNPRQRAEKRYDGANNLTSGIISSNRTGIIQHVPFTAPRLPGTNGAVIRVQPPIDQAQAVAIRQDDCNVVVCGPNYYLGQEEAHADQP